MLARIIIYFLVYCKAFAQRIVASGYRVLLTSVGTVPAVQ